MEIPEYKLIRSRRKTLSLQIRSGELIVRAPVTATDAQIEAMLRSHARWIEVHLEKARIRQQQARSLPPLTRQDLQKLAEKARQVIPERVRFYAPKVGVTYGTITIRSQRSRWGSCSSAGNLNFNCLLMLTPPEVIDSVVVHELCHRKQMNHSAKFYAEVLRVFPDYYRWDRWLKENGPALILRMKAGAEAQQ